jgi:hypothetical protein
MVVEKEVVFVDSKELENIFMELETRSTIPFVYITLRTDKLSEIVLKSKQDGTKNPYWKQITKESKKCYRLVVDYKKRVENNLLKEGKSLDEYVKGSLSGKEHLSKCILTDKKNKTERYVMVEYFENSPIKGETKYFSNGNELDKTLLSKWIVYRNNEPKNQGLDKMVHPITPKLDSITQLNVDGKIYKRRD